MTPEHDFIRKLESYLDFNFNDYGKKRIECYLKEYAASVPQIKKIDFTVIPTLPSEKKELMDEEILYKEAKNICDAYNISINDFMYPKNGKATNDIAEIRKVFCNAVLSKYLMSKRTLKEFFNVDHTTISHYIHGKRYRPIKRNAENSKVNP